MKYLVVSLAIILLTLSSGCMSFRYTEKLERTRKIDYDNPVVELAKVFVGKPTRGGATKQVYSSQTKANMGVYYRGK